MGKDFQHKGIALRAVVVLLEHAFTYLNFALVLAKVSPENNRSRALLKQLGFISEKRCDIVTYELKKDISNYSHLHEFFNTVTTNIGGIRILFKAGRVQKEDDENHRDQNIRSESRPGG